MEGGLVMWGGMRAVMFGWSGEVGSWYSFRPREEMLNFAVEVLVKCFE
jgi:hypothetical protein